MEIDYLKIIRDQVVFVATVFSVFGLIMTETYYASFGIRYQFLNLSATHVLYRGFTLIYLNVAFFVMFLVILVGVLASRFKFPVSF